MYTSSATAIPILSTLVFWQVSTSIAVSCFWPDGSLDDARVPCLDATNEVQSACCYPDDICTPSGLCFNDQGLLYRGSCTDQAWKSTGCPEVCNTGMLIMLNVVARGM